MIEILNEKERETTYRKKQRCTRKKGTMPKHYSEWMKGTASRDNEILNGKKIVPTTTKTARHEEK